MAKYEKGTKGSTLFKISAVCNLILGIIFTTMAASLAITAPVFVKNLEFDDFLNLQIYQQNLDGIGVKTIVYTALSIYIVFAVISFVYAALAFSWAKSDAHSETFTISSIIFLALNIIIFLIGKDYLYIAPILTWLLLLIAGLKSKYPLAPTDAELAVHQEEIRQKQDKKIKKLNAKQEKKAKKAQKKQAGQSNQANQANANTTNAAYYGQNNNTSNMNYTTGYSTYNYGNSSEGVYVHKDTNSAEAGSAFQTQYQYQQFPYENYAQQPQQNQYGQNFHNVSSKQNNTNTQSMLNEANEQDRQNNFNPGNYTYSYTDNSVNGQNFENYNYAYNQTYTQAEANRESTVNNWQNNQADSSYQQESGSLEEPQQEPQQTLQEAQIITENSPIGHEETTELPKGDSKENIVASNGDAAAEMAEKAGEDAKSSKQ